MIGRDEVYQGDFEAAGSNVYMKEIAGKDLTPSSPVYGFFEFG
jgi:hypothetical protein